MIFGQNVENSYLCTIFRENYAISLYPYVHAHGDNIMAFTPMTTA